MNYKYKRTLFGHKIVVYNNPQTRTILRGYEGYGNIQFPETAFVIYFNRLAGMLFPCNFLLYFGYHKDGKLYKTSVHEDIIVSCGSWLEPLKKLRSPRNEEECVNSAKSIISAFWQINFVNLFSFSILVNQRHFNIKKNKRCKTLGSDITIGDVLQFVKSDLIYDSCLDEYLVKHSQPNIIEQVLNNRSPYNWVSILNYSIKYNKIDIVNLALRKIHYAYFNITFILNCKNKEIFDILYDRMTINHNETFVSIAILLVLNNKLDLFKYLLISRYDEYIKHKIEIKNAITNRTNNRYILKVNKVINKVERKKKVSFLKRLASNGQSVN